MCLRQLSYVYNIRNSTCYVNYAIRSIRPKCKWSYVANIVSLTQQVEFTRIVNLALDTGKYVSLSQYTLSDMPTYTRVSISSQVIAIIAVAGVGPLTVGAFLTTATIVCRAFINVCINNIVV